MKEYELIKQEQIRRLEEKLGIKIDIKVEPDIEEFNETQLKEYLADLEDRLGELEDDEPDDTDSDEYDEWEDEYCEIEDLIDEVEERLEELRGQ